MDEKTINRIYEPFFTTKVVGKGTGLGLSIAYGIIKSHDGLIVCSSEPGLGTIFTIYVPVAKRPVHEKKPEGSVIPSGGTETILIAVNDRAVNKLITAVFKNFGYTVVEAENGETAVHKFLENPDGIDLLLFDMMLPIKNGTEAYQAIRKIRPDIKHLFMSDHTAKFLEDKGITTSEEQIILKPVSPEKLLKKVREVLDR
jgi:two-component system cell cycle sensor histidine kinase/response regulator CckA